MRRNSILNQLIAKRTKRRGNTVTLQIYAVSLEACMKADFLIAEITETNPSTYYLIGASQASQKPVLLLSREISFAPTEISGFKVVQYKSDNVKRISESVRLFISEFLYEATPQAQS